MDRLSGPAHSLCWRPSWLGRCLGLLGHTFSAGGSEQHLTGLLGACCAVVAGSLVVLAATGRTDARVLATIIAAALLLRARVHWDRTSASCCLPPGLLAAWLS